MFKHNPPIELQEIESETTDNGRFYILPDGTKLPSVTTVLGEQSKATIEQWKKRVGEKEANRISRNATNRGTALHLICEKYIKNESDYIKDVMPIPKSLFFSIKPILDSRINEVWYQETALYSKLIGMAGRVDFIGMFDGELSIIDFKSSTKPKERTRILNYFQQECAYALMFQDMTNIKIKKIITIIAVENHSPQIFIEKTSNHVQTLFTSVKQYKLKGV